MKAIVKQDLHYLTDSNGINVYDLIIIKDNGQKFSMPYRLDELKKIKTAIDIHIKWVEGN